MPNTYKEAQCWQQDLFSPGVQGEAALLCGKLPTEASNSPSRPEHNAGMLGDHECCKRQIKDAMIKECSGFA